MRTFTALIVACTVNKKQTFLPATISALMATTLLSAVRRQKIYFNNYITYQLTIDRWWSCLGVKLHHSSYLSLTSSQFDFLFYFVLAKQLSCSSAVCVPHPVVRYTVQVVLIVITFPETLYTELRVTRLNIICWCNQAALHSIIMVLTHICVNSINNHYKILLLLCSFTLMVKFYNFPLSDVFQPIIAQS